MVALNTAYAPENPVLGSKNRVGIFFFGRVGDRVGSDRPATRNRIGEKRPTLAIIVSGRPVWRSRDPIEEEGGLNLYVMVGNDAVNYWDYLGLSPYQLYASYQNAKESALEEIHDLHMSSILERYRHNFDNESKWDAFYAWVLDLGFARCVRSARRSGLRCWRMSTSFPQRHSATPTGSSLRSR